MSESTSAPAATPAPAAPPPASDAGGPSSPAASSQPGISVSEAGRLLSQQRRTAGQAPPPVATPPSKPSANDMVAAAKAAPAPAAPAAAPAAPAAPAADGLSPLERALGVPDAAAPAADPGEGYEIEGRRYTAAELREAINKATDYTKKTQGLSEQQRQLAAQQQALSTVLPYIQPELARLAETIQQPPQGPSADLLETNPQEYLRQRVAWESQMQEYNRISNLTSIQQEAQNRAMEQAVAHGNAVLAREFPFWADRPQREQAQADIIEWATTKGGFDRADLGKLTSPAMLKAMMKAAAFDKWVGGAQTRAPQATVGAPVRGTPPPPAPTERVSTAEQTFDTRPNIRNAAALLGARRAK